MSRMDYRPHLIAAAALGLVLSAVPVAGRRSFDGPEMRQLVTVRFTGSMPFGFRPSMDTLIDLYRQTPSVIRMRGFREAESPEPFDLVLMTSYRDFDGFERARRQLASLRTREGRTMQYVHQTLEQVSAWHRDEFIELLDRHIYRGTSDADVYVFEWVRLVPAATRAYELLLDTAVLPWERELTMLLSSESGRVIIGQDWDYVRILGFASLAGYQDYLAAWRERAESEQLALHVANRKVFVVREDASLRVR